MDLTDKWLSLATRPGVSDRELARAERELGVALPTDYKAVMARSDGGDAEFGESWIALWQARDLVERNQGLRVAEFAPGFTYFGSNGADEGYAWDWHEKDRTLYVVLPFVSPEADAAIACGSTFEEFLGTLHGGIAFTRHRAATDL